MKDIKAIIKQLGSQCIACKRLEDLTLDHIYPRSIGGPDRLENVQVLCRSCNTIKYAAIIDFRHGIPAWFLNAIKNECPQCKRRTGLLKKSKNLIWCRKCKINYPYIEIIGAYQNPIGRK